MQQPSTSVLAVLAIAVALAGCLGQAPAVEPNTTSTTPSTTAAATADAASPAATAALLPFALHMTTDRALQLDPPAEGTLTLDTPVNGPQTPGYPSWTGTLPADAAWGAEGVPIQFYATSNTASVAANNVPVLADLPGFFVTLRIGGREVGAELDGPPVIHAGDIFEISGVLTGAAGQAAAGDDVALEIDVIYSHVTTVAEFQYVFGPDQAAHLGFNGSP